MSRIPQSLASQIRDGLALVKAAAEAGEPWAIEFLRTLDALGMPDHIPYGAHGE